MEAEILEELRKINRQLAQISAQLASASRPGRSGLADGPGNDIRAQIERAKAEAKAKFAEFHTMPEIS